MPQEKKICGIKLKPINFRHLLLLELIESPVLKENATVSVVDLITVIKILSSKDNKDFKKISILEKFYFAKIYYNLEYQLKIVNEIKLFIAESLSFPKLWIKNENNIKQESDDIPLSLYSVTALISKIGFSEKDAWEMPVCKAAWYLTVYSSIEGADVSILTTEKEENSIKEKSKIEQIEKLAKQEFLSKNKKIKIVK